MRVFDFDNTLYNGESSVDFAIFMIKSNYKIIFWLPRIFWNLLLYKLCIIKKDKMENTINKFIKRFFSNKSEINKLVLEFWKVNEKKLYFDIISDIKEEDIIISACPDFILNKIINKLGTANFICSKVDIDKKKVIYLNFGDNKVKKYKEIYGNKIIDSFYTDSYNDKAMMDISLKVFLVRKGKIKEIK